MSAGKRNKILIKSKVEKLKRQYEETPTEQLAKQIRQKVRNNRVTYSKFCPEIEDFLKEQPNREKIETKKTLKKSIGEKAGNAYNKVKQKPVGLVGITTAKKGNFMKLIENIKSGICDVVASLLSNALSIFLLPNKFINKS